MPSCHPPTPTPTPTRQGRILRVLLRCVLCCAVAWLTGAGAIVISGTSARPEPADLILVLGNSVHADNRPYPRLEARLEAALALFRRGGYGSLMVSGGIVKADGRDEARGMRDWLVARGVPAERIVVDARGDNTRLSAQHAQTWLAEHGERRVVVVSQYFHLPRARLALRQAGVEDSGGDYPRRWFARDVYSILREVPGYMAYGTGWR